MIDGARDMLVEILDQVASGMRRSMAETSGTVSPIAVALAEQENGVVNILTIPILDLRLRTEILNETIRRYNPVGFVLVWDGFVVNADRQGSEALLGVLVMADGFSRALAQPYTRTPFGVQFHEPTESPIPDEFLTLFPTPF